MGCDIHLYREKHVNGQWLTADNWTPYDYGDGEKGVSVEYEERAYTGRNYELFGLLSKGVRRDVAFGFEPRGIPFNACEQIKSESAGWYSDGHSHSYLYLFEIKEMLAFIDSQTQTVSGMKNRDQLKALHESIESGSPNWDLLYPYCQGTNDPTCEEFSIEVPASFLVSDELKQIIQSFEGVEGDNHRVVFFFDN